ncbi:MAG: hypothetical protein ABFR50_08560 [Candidatus Fermentibacteria bacterium]
MGVKVGLSCGRVNWGIVGQDGKYTYYFKGEAIDGCTKSEHIAEKNEIVLDDNTVRRLRIDKKHLTAIEDGYFNLLLRTPIPDLKITGSVIPEFTNEDLQPLIFNSVIKFKEKALEIDYELNLKPYLPYHLLGKTICLYGLKNYEEANKYNEMLHNAAKEINSKEHRFKYHVLKEKISFKRSESTENRMNNIENLKAMLSEETEEVSIAALNYEISFMLSELNLNASEFAGRAMKLYRKLYKKTPRIDYRNRYEELQGS